jgi:hypothetical protein
VLAAKRMIERTMERFDLYPARLLGDSAYGSAEILASMHSATASAKLATSMPRRLEDPAWAASERTHPQPLSELNRLPILALG